MCFMLFNRCHSGHSRQNKFKKKGGDLSPCLILAKKEINKMGYSKPPCGAQAPQPRIQPSLNEIFENQSTPIQDM